MTPQVQQNQISGTGVFTSQEVFKQDLYKKIKSLIIARMIIGSTLLIGAALPLEISELYQSSRFLFRFITYILVLSIIYAFMLNRIKNYVLFAYIQLLGDILLETMVIIATGGIESPFSILYVLTIIIGSNLIPRYGAFYTSLLASAVFMAVIISQYMGATSWWPTRNTWILLPPPSFAIYIIIVNFGGFVITAFLANHLTERIRKIDVLLKDKSYQYHELLMLNDQIVRNISTGLITINREGSIVSSNNSAETMLSIQSSDGILFRHLENVLPDYLVKSILQMARDSQFNRSNLTFQKEIDDEQRWFQLEILPLSQTPRDFARLLLLFFDITDQKRLEEARRKAERWSAVAEISAGMAHEIRNPLASISGSVEVLKDQLTLNPSEEKLMQIIIRESERLNRLISEFLNFAKPHPPEFKEIDMHALLKETTMLFRNSPEWHLSIELKMDFCQEKVLVQADDNQLIQMTWNIMKNAIEAMPDGGVLVIRTEMINDPNTDRVQAELPKTLSRPYLKLSFFDTGIGMTQDILTRIFDPFTTFKRKGIGIGLAIVYRIIENHHGHVNVTSTPGAGTTFEIRLPLTQTPSLFA